MSEPPGERIWQASSWPGFRYDRDALAAVISQARLAQGGLLGRASALDTRELPLTLQDVWAEEAVATAAIEGESLDPAAVRLSVARRLGLSPASTAEVPRKVEALLDVMDDAATHFASDLTEERLGRWRAALSSAAAGSMRSGAPAPAPPAGQVSRFLAWFNGTRDVSPADGLARAGIAHAWFGAIHPDRHGGGQISCAIVAMALAQDARAPSRLLGMAGRMQADQAGYIEATKQVRCGTGDLTPWLTWFVGTFAESCRATSRLIDESLARGRYWSEHRSIGINERQRKALNRMLEAGPGRFEGGMTVRKYRSITNTTRVTASRDLARLGQVGLLARQGAGRSTFYNLPITGWAWVPAAARRRPAGALALESRS